MAISSKRANEIDAYIKQSGSDIIKGKQKIEIGGAIDLRDSYVIPWKYLLFNHDNGRFNIEIQEYEQKIGRRLDPSHTDDEEVIRKLLLYKDIQSDEKDLSELNNEGRKLIEDLKLVGEQREVAYITHDGVVVNGNRRMAALKLLNRLHPTGRWRDLWVVRLPENISEPDLWKIEAGLQLSKERVAAYDPINELLMIKDGQKAGLLNAEIAAAMYGWTEEEVKSGLARLDIIDAYLDFIGAKGNYGYIKKFRLSEYFIDIQKYTVEASKRQGIAVREIQRRLEYNFIVLRASLHPGNTISFTHNDQRKVGIILSDLEATQALTEGFENEKDLKKLPATAVMDNYSNAKDVLEYKKDKDKPKKLIEKAITALKGVDTKSQYFRNDSEIKTKLKTLDKLLSEMKTKLRIK